MADLNVSEKLKSLGVPPGDSENIETVLHGGDYMNLIDALNSPKGPIASRQEVAKILGKYGVKLGDQPMNNDYLGAKYEGIQSGVDLDETFGGILTKLNESFSYSFELNEQNRDRILDWLDENAVDYEALGNTTFRINCEDRDAAYRAGRGLSKLLGKPTVRDSVEIEEKMSKKKSDDRRVNDAKAKMADIKPRNPVVQAMAASGKSSSVHNSKDARKDMGRKAKYKPRYDEEIEENLNEGVMGMKPVSPLFRLRELAGLSHDSDIDGIEIHDAPEIDPEGMLAAGPVALNVPADIEEPVGDIDTLDVDDMGGVDMGDDLGIDDMADDVGMPGSIGTDPVEMPMVGAPEQSEAMAAIEDALNSIQTGLADIRLSEYKSLIKKLQDLTNQAQMMGRDYLGENRRKK